MEEVYIKLKTIVLKRVNTHLIPSKVNLGMTVINMPRNFREKLTKRGQDEYIRNALNCYFPKLREINWDWIWCGAPIYRLYLFSPDNDYKIHENEKIVEIINQK